MKRAWDTWRKSSWSELGLIAKGFTSIISDEDIPSPFNSSMLHIAAKAGNAEFLRKKLQEDSGDVNKADSNG